ncbi:hypothetical protein Patl1_18164 [Pistacia atlantica]|uniref:Uncharacterized protein n=1 Tax=Pistacia atlantica TaxID=434234 RepID=A0ACC1C020_9ROSI|nr:hypothetical protein Patl1_18164 [Pistacia atlantica]
MAQAVEEWYKQMPIITCTYLTAAIVTTIGCSLDIISPFNLCLHPTLVVKQYQSWSPITSFLFFRKMVKFLIDIACRGRYIKYTSTFTQMLHSNSNVLVFQNM